MKKPDNNAQLTKGEAALAHPGTDPDGIENPADHSDTKDLSSAFSTAGTTRLISGSCPSSQSFAVMGRSFTIDTSKVCDTLSMLGYVVVAMASIAAMKIFGTGGA